LRLKAFSIISSIILIGFIPSVFAETGYNYDKQLISERTYQWTSHYPRIWDGFQWVNYITSNDDDLISFDSASLSYIFDKNNCNFKLYNPITKELSINDYSHSLLIDGSPAPLGSCVIQAVNYNTDGIQIVTNQMATESELKTIYDLNHNNVEWTYEILNTGFFTTKTFGIIESCPDCLVSDVIDDVLKLKDYDLDTKNRIHNTLKTTDTKNGLSLTFEDAPKGYLSKTIIDPTFGFTATSANGREASNNPTSGDCSARTYTTSDSNFDINYGVGNFCSIPWYQFDVTSITDGSVINSATLRVDISSSSLTANCVIRELDTLPASGQTTYNESLSGTKVTGTYDCTTNASNVDIPFNAAGLTDIETKIFAGNNWYAVSNYMDDFTSPNTKSADFTNVKLQIVYTVPVPVTGTTTVLVNNIGDIFRTTGRILVSTGVPGPTIDNMTLYRNGTQIQFNDTDISTTPPQTINYDTSPIWYQALDNDLYNFTMVVGISNLTNSINITGQTLVTREYDPDYFTAVIASQGDVNYTKPTTGGLKVNRDKGGATFQIECTCFSYADAFLNQTAGSSWNNETGIGAFEYTCPSGTFLTACYNDDLLFTTSYPANSSAILVSGVAIFDQLGGMLGAPAAILMVLAIYSLGTGRNFPIISILAMSAMGVMGALGLLVFSGEVWALLMVITGVSLFGVRKFF
jgi:hypothetical protein